ncbi:hypothetical protein UPYG_G00195490 [Umbra pygmaea]|uniref:Uncharacterized protein n=1 Tax=Umbra pygmaea TaxID=75934 RepID=A0ABD0X7K5_UMBPY
MSRPGVEGEPCLSLKTEDTEELEDKEVRPEQHAAPEAEETGGDWRVRVEENKTGGDWRVRGAEKRKGGDWTEVGQSKGSEGTQNPLKGIRPRSQGTFFLDYLHRPVTHPCSLQVHHNCVLLRVET